MNLFSSPDAPARDVKEALDYLWQQHEARFLYRGQTREYPGPLLPSAYRAVRLIGADPVTDSKGQCMRGKGREFYEVRQLHHDLRSFFMAYSDRDLRKDEISILLNIVCDERISKTIAISGFYSAIRQALPRQVRRRYKNRLTSWEQLINAQHRVMVRNQGANNFLGFEIGQTLAQHYIESSEFLDASRSPTIAGFFANYAPKNSPDKPELGIIYRFDASEMDELPSSFDFYGAPAFVDAVTVARKLEENDHIVKKRWSPIEFVGDFVVSGGTRNWAALKLAIGGVENTRIGRQRAAFLVPDLIHEETRDPVSGFQYVGYQAIEDLATRENTERFYFIRGNRIWAIAQSLRAISGLLKR